MTFRLSDLSDLVRKRVAVAAYYFVPGLVFASWASRIPDVKHLLHLNNGQLGSILLAIPLGQLLMMGFSGVLVSKLGSKKMLVVAEVLYNASASGNSYRSPTSFSTHLSFPSSMRSCSLSDRQGGRIKMRSPCYQYQWKFACSPLLPQMLSLTQDKQLY